MYNDEKKHIVYSCKEHHYLSYMSLVRVCDYLFLTFPTILIYMVKIKRVINVIILSEF